MRFLQKENTFLVNDLGYMFFDTDQLFNETVMSKLDSSPVHCLELFCQSMRFPFTSVP